MVQNNYIYRIFNMLEFYIKHKLFPFPYTTQSLITNFKENNPFAEIHWGSRNVNLITRKCEKSLKKY